MTSTEPIRPPRAPSSAVAAASPTFGGVLAETVPLVGVIPVAGPPVVLLAVPWLCFGLLLAGPFALLATVVVLLVAAAALVRLAGAILAAPYLLFRHLREHRGRHASRRAPALRLLTSGSRWHPASPHTPC
jgi:hypothetical protein